MSFRTVIAVVIDNLKRHVRILTEAEGHNNKEICKLSSYNHSEWSD